MVKLETAQHLQIFKQGIVSKAWGDCASDTYITENCGILDNLVYGGLINRSRFQYSSLY